MRGRRLGHRAPCSWRGGGRWRLGEEPRGEEQSRSPGSLMATGSGRVSGVGGERAEDSGELPVVIVHTRLDVHLTLPTVEISGAYALVHKCVVCLRRDSECAGIESEDEVEVERVIDAVA